MLNLNILSVTLPLTNPVLIFSVILFIILFAPLVLHRFKIPDIVGLIIAGALIGPYGLHIMDRDSSIVLFGTVGLLYIMFVAGLEIDMADFKKNSKRSLIFGLYIVLYPDDFGNICRGLFIGFLLSYFHFIGEYVCLSHVGDLSDRE